MKIFHKGACITCKRAISQAACAGADLETRDFFKEPFSEDELEKIISRAGLTPKEMLRKKDRMYRELNLEGSRMTDSQLIRLMVRHPGLIKRPIIVTKNRVTIGVANVGES